jgi:DNA invertase Pin-like site-specific DNA recombinase
MRALGYVRLSKLSKDTTSPAKQREIIADLCKSRGWDLLETFEDLDVSGGKESRRGLDAMLLRLADADAVVVWKLDRLARSLPHLLKLAERFKEAGVQLVTTTGDVDTTTAAGKAFYGMQGLFAEFERDIITERIQGTHDLLKAQGRVQSRTPFGFRVNGDRRLEQDPDTWPTLVAMMQRVADGDSLRQLAAEYLGDEAKHTTVRVYVRNRRAHEELAREDPALADRLRARLADETYRPGARALLSGLARCSKCGKGLRQGSYAGKRNGARIYLCKNGGHVKIDADWLDAYVVDLVLKVAPWTGRKRAAGSDLGADARAALERRLAELQDEYDDGLVSQGRYIARRDKLLARLKAGAPEPKPRLAMAEWAGLSPAERRLALREVLDAVEVRPVPPGKSRRLQHPDRAVPVFR